MPRGKNVRSDRVFDEVGLDQPDRTGFLTSGIRCIDLIGCPPQPIRSSGRPASSQRRSRSSLKPRYGRAVSLASATSTQLLAGTIPLTAILSNVRTSYSLVVFSPPFRRRTVSLRFPVSRLKYQLKPDPPRSVSTALSSMTEPARKP